MKYYIIAGEASGDLHASNLMSELKKFDKNAEFRFCGGDMMIAQGGTLVKHYKEIAYMGFLEVFLHLPDILRSIKFCKTDLNNYKPDVIILVDYPGFNLRIAEYAHNNKFKVYYYISPKVWAWKQSRVYKIKKFVDKLFVIFPFEIDFYKKYDYKVEFVGNPLLDAIEQFNNNNLPDKFCNEYKLGDKPIIALLPGSRNQEIKYNLPVMFKIVKFFPDFQFIIAAVSSIDLEFYKKQIEPKQADIKIIFNRTYDILQLSEVAIVTSGTATLEAALFNVPELVCYRGDNISYQIGKRLVKVKYASLVNLIMDSLIIKEFIQYDMTIENLVNELEKIINNIEYKNNMINNFEKMRKILGGKGASKRTAKLITKQ